MPSKKIKENLLKSLNTKFSNNDTNQLLILSNPLLAEEIFTEVHKADLLRPALLLPHPETLPYDFFSPPSKVRSQRIETLAKLLTAKNTILIPIEQNLIDKIWSNKPKAKIKEFFLLNLKQAGEDYKNKLDNVCKILKKRKINKLLITAPENLAWLLNIRGKDSKYSPLPNCHAILDNSKKITLIVNGNKINNKFKLHFKNIINYLNPSYIVKYFDSLTHKETFLIDKYSCSFFFLLNISFSIFLLYFSKLLTMKNTHYSPP